MYFIGNFQYLSDQQKESEAERRHGLFSMMVQADSSDLALDNFRRRLTAFRQSSSLFEGRCAIYISQLLEFNQIPKEDAVLLNFRSYVGDPVLPYIACVVPTEQANSCTIHEWNRNHPTTEGRADTLFIEFH